MEPYNQLPLNKILCGDCKEVMKTFPDDSIDLVVTSPPYYGLRDYGLEGEQLGQESSPVEFIENLVKICEEIKRVLKKTGSFWLNLGDTYYGSGGKGGQYEKFSPRKGSPLHYKQNSKKRTKWLQPKQLLGMPWRTAIELQNNGWVLRNSVIWNKPNHMPSSVKDRLTASYEFFFFFVKARKYFFDLDSIRQPYSELTMKRITQPNIMNQKGGRKQKELRGNAKGNASRNMDMAQNLASKLTKHEIAIDRINRSYTDPLHKIIPNLKGKNPGDVWKIPTSPFPASHFATFPIKLIEPIIKSSCPEQVCRKCGIPREKIYESKPPEGGYKFQRNIGRTDGFSSRFGNTDQIIATYTFKGYTNCGCEAGFSKGVVLDPFCGSGTVLRVARKLGRNYIGIDIKKEYCKMSEQRVKSDKFKTAPENVEPLSEFFKEAEL